MSHFLAALVVAVLVPTVSIAASPRLTHERAEHDKAFKSADEHLHATVRAVLRELKKAKNQTATAEQNDRILAAWQAAADARTALSNFVHAHPDEFAAELATSDGARDALETACHDDELALRDARSEGALRALDEAGDKDVTEALAQIPGTKTLSARSEWTDTGFHVASGQLVHLEAAGTWSVSPKEGLRDAEGIDVHGFFDYRVYKQARLGALLCRVGSSDKIYAGKSLHFMADSAGDITCRINDKALGNNEGTIEVQFVPGK